MDEKQIIERLERIEFNYVISLGFFCSVAGGLEKMGLRRCSGPFDWMVTSWDGIYSMIQNRFFDFLNEEYLEQAYEDGQIYANRKYNLIFMHDFTKYKSLEKQHVKVLEKYSRRISKFYKCMESPTLFIRYIWNGEYKNEKMHELEQIERDYENFLALIKQYNKDNEIIFIANSDVSSELLPIFIVETDLNDTVSRQPIFSNMNLKNYLLNMNYETRNQNMQMYNKKQKKKNSLSRRVWQKMYLLYSKYFRKEYKHYRQYNHGEYKC